MARLHRKSDNCSFVSAQEAQPTPRLPTILAVLIFTIQADCLHFRITGHGPQLVYFQRILLIYLNFAIYLIDGEAARISYSLVGRKAPRSTVFKRWMPIARISSILTEGSACGCRVHIYAYYVQSWMSLRTQVYFTCLLCHYLCMEIYINLVMKIHSFLKKVFWMVANHKYFKWS